MFSTVSIFKHRKELLRPIIQLEETREIIGADSLTYFLSIGGLIDSIELTDAPNGGSLCGLLHKVQHHYDYEERYLKV